MAEVYENLVIVVIVVILVMEGVDRAALCSTALTLDGLGQVTTKVVSPRQ